MTYWPSTPPAVGCHRAILAGTERRPPNGCGDFGHRHDGVESAPDHVGPIHVVGHDASSPALGANQHIAGWASCVLLIVARAGVK
jgi:hypothetical protein